MKPYPIAAFKTGLLLDREPWLLPQDAFSTMTNVELVNGVIQKRLGLEAFTDTGNGNPIVGIFSHKQSNGSVQQLIHDTKRLYKYVSGNITDLDGADVLTGSRADFIHWANWKGKVYMTNGVNQAREYDGTTLQNFTIDISGGASNEVDNFKFYAIQRRRMIIFRTSESGTVYPQRARWCTVDDPDTWTNDEYVDAPTEEWITSIGMVGDDIVVWFENSVWYLKYTGDEDLPFRWDRIGSKGSSAPFSTLDINDELVTLGRPGIVSTDGLRVNNIDQNIPDEAFSWNDDVINLVYSKNIYAAKQGWMLYPASGSSEPNRILVLDYEEGGWTIFAVSNLTCFGDYYGTNQAVAWQDAVGTWAGQTGTWLGRAFGVGFPDTLVGTDDGKVYKARTGTDDAGSSIEFNLITGRLNPFNKSGQSARLGWVDFLVETSDADSLSIDFYIDFDDDSYKTETLDFSEPDSKTVDKHWIRVYVNTLADSHRMRFYHDVTGQQPKIHAIVPWFEPAGRLVH